MDEEKIEKRQEEEKRYKKMERKHLIRQNVRGSVYHSLPGCVYVLRVE